MPNWNHIWRHYGVSKDDFHSMLARQRNECPVCQRTFENGVEPNVDHCHQDGGVRGLLCRKCNTLLGWVQDDPELLSRAAAYLRRARIFA